MVRTVNYQNRIGLIQGDQSFNIAEIECVAEKSRVWISAGVYAGIRLSTTDGRGNQSNHSGLTAVTPT